MTAKEMNFFEFERVLQAGLIIFSLSICIILMALSGYAFLSESLGHSTLSEMGAGYLAEKFCCWPLALSEIFLAFFVMLWMCKSRPLVGLIFGSIAGFFAGTAGIFLKTALGFHVGIYDIVWVVVVMLAGLSGAWVGTFFRK